MAKLLQAIRLYGPRISPGRTVMLEEVAAWMAARASLNEPEIKALLWDLSEAIAHFTRTGANVRMGGVGRFRPTMGRDGGIRIRYAADPGLKASVGGADFTGVIVNPSRIGLDNDGYKRLWDRDHPDDPLET
jgi:hypothetical protein